MIGLFFNIAYQNTSTFDKMADFSVLMAETNENPAGVKITPFFEAPGWKQDLAQVAAKVDIKVEDTKLEVPKSTNTIYARSFKQLVAPGMDLDFFKSESSPSVCPLEYPFAYYHGKYCCHYQKEKTYHRQHSACDGTALTYHSSCCFGNQFTKCPEGKCKGTIIVLYDNLIIFQSLKSLHV